MPTVPLPASPETGHAPADGCPCEPCVARARRFWLVRTWLCCAAVALAVLALTGSIITLLSGMPTYSAPCAGIAAASFTAAAALRRR